MENKEKIKQLIEIIQKETATEEKIDIVKIAKKLGFVIGTIESDSKAVILANKKDKLIGVHHQLDYEEKRYLIAYELGNYLLNKKEIFAHQITSEDIIYEQDENNQFAEELLMSEEKFLKDVAEIKNKTNTILDMVKELQTIYKIPIPIILNKLEELNIITKSNTKVRKHK